MSEYCWVRYDVDWSVGRLVGWSVRYVAVASDSILVVSGRGVFDLMVAAVTRAQKSRASG